jgi:hypothetical protein
MTQPRNGRIFISVDPTPEDIARAAELPVESACPRRYCWWWKSLAFDWETPAKEGCTYAAACKPSHWQDTEKLCCRSGADSGADHYEPREPHLEQDGFAWDRFCRANNPET